MKKTRILILGVVGALTSCVGTGKNPTLSSGVEALRIAADTTAELTQLAEQAKALYNKTQKDIRELQTKTADGEQLAPLVDTTSGK